MAEIDPILERCSSRKLPLICANPDVIVKYHDGNIRYMPGNIANRYADKFGMRDETIVFGKPHRHHFEACLRQLEGLESGPKDNDADNVSRPLRVAHVGDSLHHDVAGANGVEGIDSIFVVGGIHSEELLDGCDNHSAVESDGSSAAIQLPSETKLKEFFEKEGRNNDHDNVTPTHVVPMFRL